MSDRSAQVARMRSEGKTYAQIGSALGISRQAAYWHFQRAPKDVRQLKPHPAPRPGSPRMLTYDFPLRDDLIVRVTLPVDLTEADAAWLGRYVHSLAH